MRNLRVNVQKVGVDAVDITQADGNRDPLECAQVSVDVAFMTEIRDENGNGALADESIAMRGKCEFEESAPGALHVEGRAIVVHVRIELIAEEGAEGYPIDGVSKTLARRMKGTIWAVGV